MLRFERTGRTWNPSNLYAQVLQALSNSDMRNLAIVCFASIALRLAYLWWSIPPDSPTGGHIDLWGDGLHFWLLSFLTAKHQFIYQDLKPIGLQIIWLPLHPMLAAFGMRLTGNYSPDVIRWLSIAYGTATAVVSYGLAKALYPKGTHWAFAAGLGLAFNAWWIAFSSEGIVEPLLTLTVFCMLYYWVKGKMFKTSAFVLIAAFTKYEAWFIIAVLFVISIYQRRFNRYTFTSYVLAFLTPVLAWSWWSWQVAGNPLAWYQSQTSALGWDVRFAGQSSALVAWAHYPLLITVMTLGLFMVGLVLAVKRGSVTGALALLAAGYLVFRSWGLASGSTIANERFVALLIPFAYVLSVPLLPKSLNLPKTRNLYAIGLVLLVLLPFVSQIFVFPRLAYVNYPQVRAGLWLNENYSGGVVVCDLPIVIAYAYPAPNPLNFMSTSIVYDGFVSHHASLAWLYNYLTTHNVTYFVWTNVSYSASWQIDEAQGSRTNLVSGNNSYFFKLVYADTVQLHWEHLYGVPNLYIYQIDYSPKWLGNGTLPD